MQRFSCDVRFAVVTPTYNNAGTLRDIIEKLLALNLPVIVVNDGSTDKTGAILQELASSVNSIVNHPNNRGKAAAIQSGFEAANQAGFTHVITIDTDGQHDVADLPLMISLALKNPQSLIIGERDLTDEYYPRSSLAGRVWSNRFVKLESGLSVSDSQSGLRIYPLEVMKLPTRAARYGFETEILTRCGWANVDVIETPIRCIYQVSTGRVSHFRPWRDTLSAFVMHARLLIRSMLPIPQKYIQLPTDITTTGTLFQRMLRWFSPMKAWRAIRANEQERKRFAAAIAVGVLIANLPVYGFQTVLSLIAARRLRLHPLAVVTGSHLSTPPVGVILIAAAVIVGHWILNGRLLHWNDIYPLQEGYLDLIKHMASDFIIGSILCGVGFAFISYGLVKLLLLMVPYKKSVESLTSDYIAEA